MNKLLRALSLIVFLFYLPQTLKAQTNTALLNNGFTHAKNNSVPTVSAPNISYQTPQIYNVNTSIVLLSPQNTGGAVPSTAYGEVTPLPPFEFNPLGIAIDANGNIYEASGYYYQVVEITPAGVATPLPYSFKDPESLAIDAAGNIYVGDAEAQIIYKITPGGVESVFANVCAIALTIDANGNLYAIDSINGFAIKKITPDGTVTVLAGGLEGSANGIGTKASFNEPRGLAVDASGNIFVADNMNNEIREISPSDVVTTFAGSGVAGSSDGTGTKATFYSPISLAIDAGGNIYVVDAQSELIRKISPAGVVTTLPGYFPIFGIAFNSAGILYATNNDSNYVEQISLTGYTIDKTLPSGLSFDSATGIISGTPTAVSPATNYTITAYNAGGSSSTVVNIAVVNPASSITAGTATGTISACAGSASASPNVKQFTVSASGLSDNITATAPANFEVSLSANNGYGNSVTLAQTGGTVANTVVYVRSAVSAPTGNISGNITLSSTGAASQQVAVTGVVNALPVISAVGPQVFNAGSSTTAINFTGTADTFNWVNDTPGIGLPASGTGDIASFTAINNTSKPIIATVTVTPVFGGQAYITNSGSNSISVINTASQQMQGSILGTQSPYSISVSPDGQRIYIGNYDINAITIFNVITKAVANIPITAPIGIYASPDNTRFYVASNALGIVYVYNVSDNAQIAQVNVGRAPLGMIASPDGSKLYVANSFSNTISVINTSANSIVKTFTTGASPSWIAISPDGSTLYVTNFLSNNVSVINSATGATITTIATGKEPEGIAISPDGSRVYVANEESNNVTIINTTNNTVAATIAVGMVPVNVCITSDGSYIYTTNSGSGTVSVINTATNKLTATVPVGTNPSSYGNFISPSGCPGLPVTFTITVNPSLTPTITAGPVSGNITACEKTISIAPDIQQFSVNGSSLSANITATVPAAFEISTNQNSGYSNNLTLTQNGGTLSATIIYVRASAGTTAGNISDNVVLTSTGATSQLVPVSETINAAATVDAIGNKQYVNGAATAPVTFTGIANAFSWVNNMPGIGLAASGSGDHIPSFTAINNTGSPIIATITVTPLNNNNCSGTTVAFTITVNPTPVPTTLTASASLIALTTTYGTASVIESFDVLGTNITSGISITAPPGFEVSSDGGVSFSSVATISSTGNISQFVNVRLAATTAAGDYSGNIVLSTDNATSVNIMVPTSTVNPAFLTITADDKTKPYGAVNPDLTVTYNGFVNNDGPAQLTTQPAVSTTATTLSAVGQYPITVGDAASPNYTFTYVDGILTVQPSLSLLSIPNTFTPNGDGINDTWDIKYLEYYPKSIVSVFNRWGQKVYSSIGYPNPWDGRYNGAGLPTGTYYYIIDPKNGQAAISGWVAIIR